MTRTTLATAALALGLFAACENRPPEPPPHPPYKPTATCAEACTHLASLGCDEAKPTPKGTSCAAVCLDVNASGLARFPADCLVVAPTCAEARACR